MSAIDTEKGRFQVEKASPPPFAGPGSGDPLFMEHIKGLRAKLEHLIDVLDYKVVAVTSSISGEGKTMLSVNLAMNLAASGRSRVLLVDCDMRKGDIARELRLAPAPGLTDHLCGAAAYDAVVGNSFQPGLCSIAAGNKIPSPPDLIAKKAFRDFLIESRTRFDLVLIDTPPVIPVADTIGLRELVDGFLFVYRAGRTPYSLLRQAVEELGEKKIIGVVMNGVDQQKSSYYRKYYGKYYTKPTL